MLRKKGDVKTRPIEKCHGGTGTLECAEIIEIGDSDVGIKFMHHDILEPGTVIGEHTHTGNEEIYYVLSGEGIMIMDGVKTPVAIGDISLVKGGHSHGIINSDKGPMQLLVICVIEKK